MNKGLVVEALKNDDRSVLQSIYLEHKEAFLGFANNYGLPKEDILDIYQDAIIALRENALNGHLDGLKSELRTYLFSIGKYMIYRRLKEKKKLYVSEAAEIPDDFDQIKITQIDFDVSARKLRLQNGFKQLGEQCQRVLTLFYLRGFTLDEIVSELSYSNKDVAKSQKSRCIRNLKAILSKN